MKLSEKQKFKRFYKKGALFWVVMTLFYWYANYWVFMLPVSDKTLDFLLSLLSIVLIFIVIGIPVIFVFSLFIRLGAWVIDRIPKE